MSYTRHEWANGEKITAEKLNNIEDGIDGMKLYNEESIDRILYQDSFANFISNYYEGSVTDNWNEYQKICLSIGDETYELPRTTDTDNKIWFGEHDDASLPGPVFTNYNFVIYQDKSKSYDEYNFRIYKNPDVDVSSTVVKILYNDKVVTINEDFRKAFEYLSNEN